MQDPTTYTAGPEGQHFNVHPYFGWQAARCQRSRPFTFGSRCISRNGSGLPGLRKALCLQPPPCIFRYPGKIKHAIQKTLFTSSRQDNWVSMRLNNYSYPVLHKQTLPRQSASSKIQGCRHREDIRVSHQQFQLAGINCNSTVSQQVAGGTFFQMDQAAPKDKESLWYFRECRKNSGLDSSLCLYPRSDNEKAAQPLGKSLHNFTNFESISFRKDRTSTM